MESIFLYNDIALSYQNNYEVTVLTTTPLYNLIKESLERQPQKNVFGHCISNFNE